MSSFGPALIGSLLFTFLIAWLSPRLGRFAIGPDRGSWWGWDKLYRVAFIPVATYGGALVLAGVARLAGMASSALAARKA